MSNSASDTAMAPVNLNQTMKNFGFRPIDPFGLLNDVTHSFGVLIQEVFAWVYFLSEITILVGVLVYLVGAIGHHSRVKRTGAQIVLYSIVGFFAAVILPGVIVAIDSHFHG